jgi:hypothetical protein
MNAICIIAHIFYTQYHFQGSWDSIVGTETGLYNGPCGVQIPVGARDFSFPITSGPALGPTQPQPSLLFSGYEGSFMRAIWPEQDVDCFLHLSPVLGMSGDAAVMFFHSMDRDNIPFLP